MDHYPTEAGLSAAREIYRRYSEADWLVNGVPLIVSGLCCQGCFVEDYTDNTYGPSKLVDVATGGWSGCERFMEAVLENPKIRSQYFVSDRSNGVSYVFGVPMSDLTLSVVDYAKWANYP